MYIWYIHIHIYIYIYVHTNIYIYMVFTIDGLFEVAMESWPEDLNSGGSGLRV